MNIIKHLNLTRPSIEIEEKSFNIEITGEVMEITCQWDHGWGGRGTESCTIPLQLIEGLLADFKKATT